MSINIEELVKSTMPKSDSESRRLSLNNSYKQVLT